jgi:hypothetical protein
MASMLVEPDSESSHIKTSMSFNLLCRDSIMNSELVSYPCKVVF